MFINQENVNKIQSELSNLKLLDHDFYKIMWNEGLLSMEDLKYYSEQYYFIEENFLSCLKKASNLECNNENFLKIIHENIADEAGKGENKQSHLSLWSKFAEFCGSKISDLSTNAKHKNVQNILDRTAELTNKSIPSAIGVFYAYEWQIPEISESKIKGLVKYYGAKAGSAELDFFEEHKVADIWHTKQWNSLISNFTAQEFAEFQESSVETAKLLLGFLDGVIETRELCC